MAGASVQSFTPVYREDARILILGSMPGKVSLAAHRYYAHPRNTFWRIMSILFGFDMDSDYEERCQALIEQGIALWDVLGACERESSLDADIIESSIVPNDIPGLLNTCPDIERIYFNGTKAEQAFGRYVMPELTLTPQSLRLPSTSPAHAAMSFEEKLEHWRTITASQATEND